MKKEPYYLGDFHWIGEATEENVFIVTSGSKKIENADDAIFLDRHMIEGINNYVKKKTSVKSLPPTFKHKF